MHLPHHALPCTLLLASALSAQLPLRSFVETPDGSPGFAAAAAATGDLDGDGVSDFAVAQSSFSLIAVPDAVQFYSGASGALLRSVPESAAGEAWGETLADVGDLNGDGLRELLVGAPSADGAGTNAGRAAVLSGADGSALFEFLGATGDALGSRVAAAGDLDGDGVPDLLITSADEDLLGSKSGIVRLRSGADGSSLLVFGNGATTGDLFEGFGDALAAAGDLDGDGVGDVLIAAPDRLLSGVGRIGAVEARSGVDGALLFVLEDPLGSVHAQRFGAALAAGVDLTGDGVGEILVGARGDSQAGPFAGAVYVYDGASQALLHKHLGSADTNNGLGLTVAYVGDVNGDGFPDYAGGSRPHGGVNFSGYVRVWSGSDHGLLDEVRSNEASDAFGSCLAALGDLDGDLLPDFLVGAPQDERAWIVSVAGAREYGQVPTETTQALSLSWSPAGGPDPARGTIVAAGAPPSAPGLFAVSESEALSTFLGATLLVDLFDPAFFVVSVAYDDQGGFASKETTLRQPALDGISLYCQTLAIDLASPLGFLTSAALELRLSD